MWRSGDFSVPAPLSLGAVTHRSTSAAPAGAPGSAAARATRHGTEGEAPRPAASRPAPGTRSEGQISHRNRCSLTTSTHLVPPAPPAASQRPSAGPVTATQATAQLGRAARNSSSQSFPPVHERKRYLLVFLQTFSSAVFGTAGWKRYKTPFRKN